MTKKNVTYLICLNFLLMAFIGCEGVATLFHGPKPDEGLQGKQGMIIPAGFYDGAMDEDHLLFTQNLSSVVSYLNSNALSEHHYYIVLGTDEYISPIIFNYNGKTVSITIRGDKAERKINLGADGYLFTIGKGWTLTLDENITLIGKDNNSGSLVVINKGGTLVLNDGAKIKKNTKKSGSSGGGGVYINGGTFTMVGGEISENIVASTSVFSNNGQGRAIAGGGGVYVSGGGNFTMSGGRILENKADSSAGGLDPYQQTYSYGGGVYVGSNGTFTMIGGELKKNRAVSSASYAFSAGGGVYVSGSGTFTMSGGKIRENRAESSDSSTGGGVYIYSPGGIFTINGGEISGNTPP
jgi:hypothetical protein